MRLLALLFEGDEPPLDPHQSIGEHFLIAAGKPGTDQIPGNARYARRQCVSTCLKLVDLALCQPDRDRLCLLCHEMPQQILPRRSVTSSDRAAARCTALFA